MQGYRSRKTTENGKRTIVFKPHEGYTDLPVIIPCGQCIGCKLERSRQWAMRCVHEASLYQDNCFLTLTYDNEHLPEDRSLNKKHFQDFMKRFRKDNKEITIKYFHCGEYGEDTERPHYHACVFNFDFQDKQLWKIQNGHRLYISPTLQKLWKHGYAVIGDVTFDSAAYVARYILKKITGNQEPHTYLRINHQTGELYYLNPEYATMSRNPGIGKKWFEKYKDEIFPDDFVIINGKKSNIPRFYSNQYEATNKGEFNKIQKTRLKKMLKHADDNSFARLAVKETVKLAQLAQLKRPMEKNYDS